MNRKKWEAVVVTAALTGLSATIAYVLHFASDGGFGDYSPLFVAGCTVAGKFVYKYLSPDEETK